MQTFNPLTNTHEDYEGNTPRDTGIAVLASGNIALVSPDGSVAAICPVVEVDVVWSDEAETYQYRIVEGD